MHLTNVLDVMEVSFARTVSWAYSNMCRHKNPNAPLDVLRQLSHGLFKLIQHEVFFFAKFKCWGG